MRVLMLGWEFPPYNMGGLGIACEGLAKSFVKQGMNVTFIMPKAPLNAKSNFCKLIVADHEEIEIEKSYDFKIHEVDSLLTAYTNETQYKTTIETLNHKNKQTIKQSKSEFSLNDQYGKNLYEEVWRYTLQVKEIVKKENFDIIHAHDWMTFQAGIEAKKESGKPLIIHIHNTALDRSGGNPNPREYDIEKNGFEKADRIIAISQFVKNTLTSKYHIPENKISIVHNGIDLEKYSNTNVKHSMNKTHKIVLFAGRVTLQKGPDYFVEAAHKVSQHVDNVKFILAGSGDMLNASIEKVAELGMSNKFIFTGRYTKEEGEKLMSMADVFVMPSVSEPFGLVPLEAMTQGTPTIISKQSGVSEVVTNTLKADFWDTKQLANQIVATLNYPALNEQLGEYGLNELKGLTWDPAAIKCKGIFNSFINK